MKVIGRLVLALLLLCGLACEQVAFAKNKSRKSSEDENSYNEDYDGDKDEKGSSKPLPVGVSGGVGVGSGYFAATLTISYGLNRFLAIDTSGFYRNEKGDNYSSVAYGPEVDLILRLPNPSIVTPFVGVGPGYELWKRTHDGVTFDETSSLTANGLIGINVGLTKNFGIQIAQKWTTYLNRPPLKWSDHSEREARTFSRTQIGFLIMF